LSCIIDEGIHAIRERPLGIGFQEQVSNRHKLLWSRAMVVNVDGKGRKNPVRYVRGRRTKVNRPMRCRKFEQ
jgi:hypothetical protein